MRLAYGRSGDKGDKANIGIFARRPEYLPLLNQWLTPERVAAHFAHNAPSRVERFACRAATAMNFLLHDVLGGGGMASLRTDNLAKCYAQVLLSMDVPVPDDICRCRRVTPWPSTSHKLKAWPFKDIEQRYTERDTILYALGVGIGHDPLDRDALRYVYEDGLQALPTMAVVLGYPGFWAKDPATGIDWVQAAARRAEPGTACAAARGRHGGRPAAASPPSSTRAPARAR